MRSNHPSRRDFVADVGRLTSAVLLCGSVGPIPAPADDRDMAAPSDWDLSWIGRLRRATDRAVFDWPNLGDPADPIVMELAARYLDNCEAAYGAGKYRAGVVLNIRTVAIPAAMTDALWERYALGAEYNIKDLVTKEPAVRNQFWRRPADSGVIAGIPTLEELVQRGAMVLVCDFAMGHLATRLANKVKRNADEVHQELRAGLVPNTFAVPSGIFGLAKAQNAGCAYLRV